MIFLATQTQWRQDSQRLSDIRRQVFIEEQGVSDTEEWDGKDPQAHHFCVATDAGHNSDIVGCARVLEEPWQGGRGLHIGRVAVLKPWRGLGAGKTLMFTLLDWCQNAQTTPHTVFLHAQLDALAFYEKLGFTCVGGDFLDAGIIHRSMVLTDFER